MERAVVKTKIDLKNGEIEMIITRTDELITELLQELKEAQERKEIFIEKLEIVS